MLVFFYYFQMIPESKHSIVGSVISPRSTQNVLRTTEEKNIQKKLPKILKVKNLLRNIRRGPTVSLPLSLIQPLTDLQRDKNVQEKIRHRDQKSQNQGT
jgi:hypothetical protein